MAKTIEIARASVGFSANLVYTGFKRFLVLMGIAGAIGAGIIVALVALIAAIIR